MFYIFTSEKLNGDQSLLCVVQESSALVGWSSLLVIQNVPPTSNCSSEVQKLVRRFGTVIRSLVLHNMVN